MKQLLQLKTRSLEIKVIFFFLFCVAYNDVIRRFEVLYLRLY